MTSAIRSREETLYTPSESEDPVCTTPPPNPEADGETMTRADGTCTDGELVCQADPLLRQPIAAFQQGPGREDIDYLTVSGGAGAIIGGNLSLTVDRDGHLYVGLAAGVGLSATIVSASVVAGQMTTSERPNADQLDKFLEGDSVSAHASLGAEAGLTNSAGGTAVEMGLGLVQAGTQFQHNWHVANLPIRW